MINAIASFKIVLWKTIKSKENYFLQEFSGFMI